MAALPALACTRAFWLRAADGVRLRAALWPDEAPRGTLLLFPGRTEFVEKYHPIAAHFAAQGLAVLAIDWRGQGASDRLIADRSLGHVEDFADYQQDVAALVEAANALSLPRPWRLLAHSMGGAIGLRALHRGLAVASASLSAPMWGIPYRNWPDRIGMPWQALVTGLACLLGFGQREVLGRTAQVANPADPDSLFRDNLLTSDPGWWHWAEGLYAALPDLAIGAPTYAWGRAALAECRALARLPMSDLPALISVSQEERLVSAEAIRAGATRWPGARLLDLPAARHEALFERPAAREALLTAISALTTTN